MNDDVEFLAASGQYGDVLRRRKRVLAIGMIVAAVFSVLALGLTGGGPSLRIAEATVEVRPVTANRFGSNTRPKDLVSMPTELEIMRSSDVAQRVVDRLGLDDDPEDLLANLRVVNPTETLILKLEYESGNGDVARTRVQAFAEEYLAYRKTTLEATIASSIEKISQEVAAVTDQLAIVTVRAVDENDAVALANLDLQSDQLGQRVSDLQAQIADFQGIFIDPGAVVTNARLLKESGAPGWITAAGILGLGLVASVGAAVVVDRLDERPRDETEVTGAVPAPVYGVQLTELGGGDDDEGLGIRAAKARRTLGEYRRLRLRLEGFGSGRITSVLVATPVDDNAAGEVATNLARVVLQGRETAVLVWNEDIRRGALDDLGAKITSKLDDVINGQRALDDVLKDVPGQPGMALVGLSVGQTSAVAAGQLRAVYAELAERFDIVITVAPSASPADTAELATFTEATVLAVDTQRSTRTALRRAVQSLHAVDATVVAAFVTRGRPWW